MPASAASDMPGILWWNWLPEASEVWLRAQAEAIAVGAYPYVIVDVLDDGCCGTRLQQLLGMARSCLRAGGVRLAVLWDPDRHARDRQRIGCCLRWDNWTTRPGKWRRRQYDQTVEAAFCSPVTGSHLALAHSLDITDELVSGRIPLEIERNVAYRMHAFLRESWSPVDWLAGDAADVAESLICRWLGASSPVEVCDELVVALPGGTPPRAANAIPWSDGVEARFREEHGRELHRLLPALVTDVGVVTSEVRQQFAATVQGLYRRSTIEGLAGWAERGGFPLQFMVSGTDAWRCGVYGDPFMTFQGQRVLVTCDGDDAEVILTTKLFAACSAPVVVDLAPAMEQRPGMTRTEACVLSAGVTPTPVAALASDDGPSAVTTCGAAFETLTTRLTAVRNWMGQGIPVRRLGLLFPQRSLTAYPPWCGEDPLTKTVRDDLIDAMRHLDRYHYDADVVSEQQLLSAVVAGSSLDIGERTYQMLVLPTVTTLSAAAWQRVVEFADAGGMVAAIGLLPVESERGEDRDLAAQVAKDTMVDAEAVVRLARSEATGTVDEDDERLDIYPVFRELPLGGRLCSYQPRLVPDQTDAVLRVRQILFESMPPDFESGLEELGYQRSVLAEQSRYLLVNRSDASLRATPRLVATGHPLVWDVSRGEEHDASAHSRPGANQLIVPLAIPPRSAMGITVVPGDTPHVDSVDFEADRLEVEEEGDVYRLFGFMRHAGQGNVAVEWDGLHATAVRVDIAPTRLPVTGWTLEVDGAAHHELTWEGWRQTRGAWLARSQWHGMPLSGVMDSSCWLRTRFTMRSPLPDGVDIHMELAGAEVVSAALNRTDLKLLQTGPRKWTAILGRELRTGANDLRVEIAGGSPPPVAYLIGPLWRDGDHDFTMEIPLQPRQPFEWLATQPVAGEVLASGIVDLPPDLLDRRLVFVWSGGPVTAAVEWNGIHLGTALGEMMEFDLEDCARTGTNQVRICATYGFAHRYHHANMRSPVLVAFPRVIVTGTRLR